MRTGASSWYAVAPMLASSFSVGIGLWVVMTVALTEAMPRPSPSAR